MRDLTQGPISGHLFAMAAPIAAGMLAQTLYFLIDLYFVARLGDTALAGVGAAGIAMFVVMAMTQTLGVGAMALVAQAVGRKDPADADLVFNQSFALAGVCTVATLIGGYLLAGPYMRAVGADAETAAAGTTYLKWFLPGLALQYLNVVMLSGLRGTGVVQPTMVVQIVTVLLNALLAPILIAGWLSGQPMGVAGAGLASSISVAFGSVLLVLYFHRLEKYIHFRPALWRPRFDVWRRMINIGLPAGGEFAFIFVYMAVIYWVIRGFGPAAQAGFGLGTRLMQSIMLPAMAVAFATGPIAGQNFGAKLPARVRETFWSAVKFNLILMIALTLVCQVRPEWLILFFTKDPVVVETAAHFLRLISWNFTASGLVFVCSGIFQGLGHTWPALGSTATRVATFMLPAIWLSTLPGFAIDHVWYRFGREHVAAGRDQPLPALAHDEGEAHFVTAARARTRAQRREGRLIPRAALLALCLAARAATANPSAAPSLDAAILTGESAYAKPVDMASYAMPFGADAARSEFKGRLRFTVQPGDARSELLLDLLKIDTPGMSTLVRRPSISDSYRWTGGSSRSSAASSRATANGGTGSSGREKPGTRAMTATGRARQSRSR